MRILYTLLIYPLELLFEVIFSITSRLISNPGWAIVILSLAVNFLVLPLYNRADELQKEERDLEASIAPGIERIKKAFKGDERMMMLQAYYRENNYSPLYVLKGSFSLLLQIPFFVAAYNFLSNLMMIRGVSFGPIPDLGAPDKMLVIAGVSLNLLPILMTLINIIAGYIYTRGMPLKSKLQLYLVAFVFLILLYDSPSGLVFYWTLNNVFSLLKNIVTKAAESSVSGPKLSLTYSTHTRNVFILSGFFLTALIGALIPSALICSSPTEFMNFTHIISPNLYIIHSAIIAAGYFIVWGGVFFYFFRSNGRVILSWIWLALCPIALITYMFFGTSLGFLSQTLTFENSFTYSLSTKLINILITSVAAALLILISGKFNKPVQILMALLIFTVAVMSINNMRIINRSYKDNQNRLATDRPEFTLSTEGHNVMVIMLDRAPGYFVPIIFNEIPQLQEQFDGFTYYPNTLSFGARTKHATPALFGGYDYTPQLIVADTEKSMVQTQNEALSLMPILFRNHGYEVSIFDPPFAGYMTPPDLRVFQGPEYEGINAYLTIGNTDIVTDDYNASRESLLYRNLFCYSIMKSSPVILQGVLYNQGNYNMTDTGITDEEGFSIPQIPIDTHRSTGVSQSFMENYNVLDNLDSITNIVEGDLDTFMYIDNELPHAPMLLQEPEYEPAQFVDNTQYDIEHADRFSEPVYGYYLNMNDYVAMKHYQTSVAAYMKLGEYFDYLRSMGVWDNTRIIIVADHSICAMDAYMFGLETRVLDTPPGASTIDAFNPVLMVKDFGSTGFNTCEDLMTNADVPYLAVNGLIDNPVNPFTGNPIIPLSDYSGALCVYDSYDFNLTEEEANGETTRFVEGNWYDLQGTNVFDRDAWVYVGWG